MPFNPGLPFPLDRLRLALIDMGEPEYLDDATYIQLIADTASLTAAARAAAGIIEGIIRRIPVTRSANGESVSYAGQAEFYRRIATGETPLPLLDTPVEAAAAAFSLVPVVFRSAEVRDEYSR